MKTRIILIVLITCNSYQMIAQTLERQVFNSFGNAVAAPGIYYEQNAGETLTTTHQSGGYWLLQGFIQPGNIAVGISDCCNEPDKDCPELYPNPFQTQLYFKGSGKDVSVAWLSDATGRRIWQIENPGNEITLPNDLSEGFYLLILGNSRRQVTCSYRLIHCKF